MINKKLYPQVKSTVISALEKVQNDIFDDPSAYGFNEDDYEDNESQLEIDLETLRKHIKTFTNYIDANY